MTFDSLKQELEEITPLMEIEMFDPETVKSSSLSGLGAMLLDAIDEGVRNDEPVEVENACVEIGNEIIFRVPNADKLRHLMDFHYKKWADMLADDNSSDQRLPTGDTYTDNSYLELRAMMAGYVQIHCPTELEIDD